MASSSTNYTANPKAGASPEKELFAADTAPLTADSAESVGEHTVRGEVLRIVYANDAGDYVVIRLKDPNGAEFAESLVVPVPEALDPALAVASRMAGVATTVLYVSEIRESPWVAVFGLGMVGNLAAQALQIRGCRVIGIDPNAARRELAGQCGIRKVIGGSPAEVQEQIRTLTGGRGVGIAVDAVGHSAVVQSALAVTADYGQLILLGSPRTPVQANLGQCLSSLPPRTAGSSPLYRSLARWLTENRSARPLGLFSPYLLSPERVT